MSIGKALDAIAKDVKKRRAFTVRKGARCQKPFSAADLRDIRTACGLRREACEENGEREEAARWRRLEEKAIYQKLQVQANWD